MARRKNSLGYQKDLTERATQISAECGQLQQFYFINPLTGDNHLPFGQSQPGQMWGDCQGQKWTAPQGVHGKYLLSLSHMVPAAKENTKIKAWYFFHPLKAKGPGSNICRSKQLVVSQEEAGPLFNRCRLYVHRTLIFFTRTRQRTVVFPSAPSSITYVLYQTIAAAKTREKSSSGVFQRAGIYSLFGLVLCIHITAAALCTNRCLGHIWLCVPTTPQSCNQRPGTAWAS